MKYIIPIMVILLLLSSSFVEVPNTAEELIVDAEEMEQSTSDGPLDSPWPMESHDVRHTGRSP